MEKTFQVAKNIKLFIAWMLNLQTHFEDTKETQENGKKKMNKKMLGITVVVIVVCALVAAAILAESVLAPSQQPTRALDFNVSASSDCLRFLNNSVPTIYVPFTVAANENWQLTINCTKMPGGTNGYTDVYIYEGYWNGGSNNTCISSDLYPILSDIHSIDHQIRLGQPFTEIYSVAAQQSYTVFFVVPPGGQQATFHITLKQVQ
jgi:hypothetical protein